ncbi:unnamed protein product [Tilletia caries]|uniref:Saccharopine dehydrogenase NADP binding domain-containing protein n=1 Tax=Tilletia caries TaxID=13290 RepID=A0ABN7IQ32_9BASI|nr:unnamed protein product [Tilletia caries]
MHSVYLNALCQHVSGFGFLEGRMSDSRIRAFGRVYHLHRLFLVQASFFNGLFCAGFAEGLDGIGSRNKNFHGRADDGDEEDDDGSIDLPFEDPNITRPAFEYCIAHLYGAAPELVLPEWASPQPTQPLSSAFVVPAVVGPPGSLSMCLPGSQSAPSVANADGSSSSAHPATPRFLLSLLATSIYLGIPSVTTHVITLILYSITPFTIMHYLRFATGQTILGASEAMQRSLMHEIALSAPIGSDDSLTHARPDVWDWELEGPVSGLEHLGKIQRRAAKHAQPSASAQNRTNSKAARSTHTADSILQQTKNLSLNDDGTSTGPNSVDGHQTTAPASPQPQFASGRSPIKQEDRSAHTLSGGSPTSVVSAPGSDSTQTDKKSDSSKHGMDGKRAGDLNEVPVSEGGTYRGDASKVEGASGGRTSRTSKSSEGSTIGTDYLTDEAEMGAQAPFRSYPVRPPLMGEAGPEMGQLFRQPFQRQAQSGAHSKGNAQSAGKPNMSRTGHLPGPRVGTNKRSHFFYGDWGEKMGEACACWLIRFGADILEEEIAAEKNRAVETEAWMVSQAQTRSKRFMRTNLEGDGELAPWQLALQIPSGEGSNSIYGSAGFPASPSPFGKKSAHAYQSTPRGASRAEHEWRTTGDGYDSDENQGVEQTPAGPDAHFDAPDEDRFIQTYMLPYGQLPEKEQLARPPPLLVWSLGHMSADWVREIISSDSFFVWSEWDRFIFATRVVELRRRQKLRRLAVLKLCGDVEDDGDETESTDDDRDPRADNAQPSDASTSEASLGEQWRRLTGEKSSQHGGDGDDDGDDGDDDDDDDDMLLYGQSHHGRSARRSSGTRALSGKGKSAPHRRDRSPASRRTSFASNANVTGEFQRPSKGTPGTPGSKRSSGRALPHAFSKGDKSRAWSQRNSTVSGPGLPRDADEHEHEELFKKGVYYTHMSFDELNRISSKVSPTTGTTFVPLAVLQSALWAGSELKNHILASRTPWSGSRWSGSDPQSSSSADPPPQLPNINMWPENGDDDNHVGGPVGAEQGQGPNGGGTSGQGMSNSAVLPPVKDLNISSTLSEFRLAADAMLKGNSSLHGHGNLFDPNLSYLMGGQDQTRPPITLGGHMASPLMLGAASKPGALLSKRYFPVLTDSTVRLGGSTTPIFGSGGASTQAAVAADKSGVLDGSQAPPSPATTASGAMGVAAAKDPLAFTVSSSLHGTTQSSSSVPGTLVADVAATLEGGQHSSTFRSRAAKYFGISNCVRTGRELAADATVLEEAQARVANELSEESSFSSDSEMGDVTDEKGQDGDPNAPAKNSYHTSGKYVKSELIRNELENSRWTGYEPMRIGAEFHGVDTLADKQRLYSPTFFYAGSLWNLYVQTTKKSKGLQLGVYLHRQAPHDPIPMATLPPNIVPRLIRRADEIPIERSTTPRHAPRDNVRGSQQRGGVPSALRQNQGSGGGNVPSLYLNIPTTPGLPNNNATAGPSNAGGSHQSSIVIASASAGTSPGTMSLPGANSSSLGSGPSLSSSPGRSITGPFMNGTGSSIVANTQAPIGGSALGAGGTGGSLFQAVNARYQEVAAADNAANTGDAQAAHGHGGTGADATAQGTSFGSVPRESATQNMMAPAASGPPSATTYAMAPLVPYSDPRRELRACFSIHCPSPLGSSLTRFSSGPDRFALTQSWGWKSSSLLMTMYLPERKLTEAKTEAHRSFRSMPRYSLTVFGATGFTAKLFSELLGAELAKGEEASTYEIGRDANFTWALAGRSAKALEAVADSLDLPPAKRPGIIVADVMDQDSLVSMCKQSVLVLNCVGPYAFFGHQVVRAVLQANEEIKLADPGATGISYLDITGEPNFIEKSCLENHRKAQELGITILHSAGFDSVPADLGVLFTKQKLLERSVQPTSIEMFFQLNSGKRGFGIHFATYASAVNGFSTRHILAKTRKALGSLLPRPPKPAALAVGLSDGLPRRQTRVPGVLYAPEYQDATGSGQTRGTYLLPFFFADPAVVRLSHALDVDLKTKVPPIKLVAWINIPKLRALLLVITSLSFFGIMAGFKWGRSSLLRFPKLFSSGMVSHEGPTRQQIQSTSFLTTLVARGHSSAAIANASNNSDSKSARRPDHKINVLVSGPEPGYDATPLCMLACVEVMLSPSQRDLVRRGVLTPSVALGGTRIIDVLQSQPGGVRFKVVDPPQI